MTQEPPRHWFEDLADHMGPAYLRYSFTRGTEAEVGFLVQELELSPGSTVLDVGCGPGRHALALAARGIRVVGVDISTRFIEVARRSAERADLEGLVVFHRADARALSGDPRFDGLAADAAISLCQGAFGLGGQPDPDDPLNLAADTAVLRGMHSSLAAGAPIAVSAFSSYFQVRWLEDHDTFDAATAVNHETTEVADSEGETLPGELWTTCYTPRELALVAQRSGFEVTDIWSVSPGSYERRPPSTDSHEFLLVARRVER
ncbi:MAG: class I SAM-dependent methyltransferase [Microthrixaceae bacterium]